MLPGGCLLPKAAPLAVLCLYPSIIFVLPSMSVGGGNRKRSDPLRSLKFNIFIIPRLKVLGSAFGESISQNIVREVMVMHESADPQFIPEQVLSFR